MLLSPNIILIKIECRSKDGLNESKLKTLPLLFNSIYFFHTLMFFLILMLFLCEPNSHTLLTGKQLNPSKFYPWYGDQIYLAMNNHSELQF